MSPNPLQTIIVVSFWYLIPKKITIPPAKPRKIDSIPKITSSISTPKVKGVNIPESNATAPIMYAYFVPDRSNDFKSREVFSAGMSLPWNSVSFWIESSFCLSEYLLCFTMII